MKPVAVRAFFAALEKANPYPTTELNYSSTFELLSAVLLSAQATDVSVNKATSELFRVANTPEQMLVLGQERLENYIKTIGLYKTKAKHLIATCDLLKNKHQGVVPKTREELESLPGVGRKTANVILNTAFGEPTIAVDTHIFRVANRTQLAKGKTPLEVELRLLKAVPKIYQHNAHHWLILLGRYTCKARQPVCTQCPVSIECGHPKKVLPPHWGET